MQKDSKKTTPINCIKYLKPYIPHKTDLRHWGNRRLFIQRYFNALMESQTEILNP